MLVSLDNINEIAALERNRLIHQSTQMTSSSKLRYANIRYTNSEERQTVNDSIATHTKYMEHMSTVVDFENDSLNIEKWVSLFNNEQFEVINIVLTSFINKILKHVCKASIAIESMLDIPDLIEYSKNHRDITTAVVWIKDYITYNAGVTDSSSLIIESSHCEDDVVKGIVTLSTYVPNMIFALHPLADLSTDGIKKLFIDKKTVHKDSVCKSLPVGIHIITTPLLGLDCDAGDTHCATVIIDINGMCKIWQ